MSLENKIVIVTGGAQGIGYAIAEHMLREKAKVVIADVNDEEGKQAAKTLSKINSCTFIHCDVSQKLDVHNLVASTLDLHERIDVLVNNAGMIASGDFLEIEEDDFDRVMAVNMKAIYLTSRAVVPIMKAQGAGNILNIASTAGVSPRPRLNWYNASKGWLITATKAMAVELAPDGIRVNALNPVAGETPLLKYFMGEDTPEMRAKFLSTIPLGRFSTPEDMANAACFLCSDEASMITGTALEVDGGRCI